MPVANNLKLERNSSYNLYIIKDLNATFMTADGRSTFYLVFREDELDKDIKTIRINRNLKEVMEKTTPMTFGNLEVHKIHVETPDIEDLVELAKATIRTPITDLTEQDRINMEMLCDKVNKAFS